MNEIIAKAVEELKQDTPNIDYVRGMLETLLAMNVSPQNIPRALPAVSTPVAAQVFDGIPMPNIDKIKDIAAKSTEIE